MTSPRDEHSGLPDGNPAPDVPAELPDVPEVGMPAARRAPEVVHAFKVPRTKPVPVFDDAPVPPLPRTLANLANRDRVIE
jgi:hypothetical protein